MRLLIIEDEQDLARPLQQILKKRGYAVDLAVDGEQGLALAQDSGYDCLLLDLNLPKIDGITLAKRLREEGNVTPIIMLTARSQLYDKLHGFQHGADDYITKPFEVSELIARIEAVVKRFSLNKDIRLRFSTGELRVPKTINHATPMNKQLFWGIQIPANPIKSGTYTGQNFVVGVKSNPSYW